MLHIMMGYSDALGCKQEFPFIMYLFLHEYIFVLETKAKCWEDYS